MTALYTLAALSLATSLAWPGLCLVFWPVHVANDNFDEDAMTWKLKCLWQAITHPDRKYIFSAWRISK